MVGSGTAVGVASRVITALEPGPHPDPSSTIDTEVPVNEMSDWVNPLTGPKVWSVAPVIRLGGRSSSGR